MKRFEVYKAIGGVSFNKPHIKIIKTNKKDGVSVWFVGKKRNTSGTWRHLRVKVIDKSMADELYNKLKNTAVDGDLCSDFMEDLKNYMFENKIAIKRS